MTLNNNNPWSEISTASPGAISKLRTDSDSAHSVYWFRDDRGHCGLLVEIDNAISKHVLNKARINIRDIQTDVVEIQEEHFRALIIKLEELQNRDVFLKLCIDLIEWINRCHENDDVFHAVCTRLKKWQSLLSGKSKKLLNARERQGLYAELHFISECLNQKDTIKPQNHYDLVKSWEGPEDGQHDFVLNDFAIEIKSIAGNQRSKIRISSEDQLYTHLSELFLRIYFLSETNEDDAGESLNGIVERINNILEDNETRELFDTKLTLARYINLPDYDYPKFKLKDIRTYSVGEGFPRITPDAVPEAVEAVSYDLILAGIERFRTVEDILEKL
ncbi:Putative PD-(D/E)XK family member [Nitrosomonas aestuarii]|uniref:Putative PD-(D/E)XK family member n=2 Tax=Nitrosomonas aestuarii TaxID=52441 RepID=A0A1I4B8F4_9PROT|nr:Putative PD-(D/E)XK family member [Nitrosomonas aestuarii]